MEHQTRNILIPLNHPAFQFVQPLKPLGDPGEFPSRERTAVAGGIFAPIFRKKFFFLSVRNIQNYQLPLYRYVLSFRFPGGGEPIDPRSPPC